MLEFIDAIKYFADSLAGIPQALYWQAVLQVVQCALTLAVFVAIVAGQVGGKKEGNDQ